MECPACETHQILRIRTLTEGIRTRECPSCEGRWIQSDDYWRWRSRSSETPGGGDLSYEAISEEPPRATLRATHQASPKTATPATINPVPIFCSRQ